MLDSLVLYRKNFHEFQRVVVILVDLFDQFLNHSRSKQGHVLRQNPVQLILVDLL